MKFHKIIQKISTGLFRRAAFHSPFSILHSARNGFTLIELIVVLGITAFLSSIMISYNHTSRQQLALYAEETKLAQVIYRAKSLSLASYIQSSDTPICGYGVHIDYVEMEYSLFSYNKSGITNCKTIGSINLDSETIISSFNINNNVKFINPPEGTKRLEDVLFVPPDPLTLIGSGGSVIKNGSAAVILETIDNSFSASIIVNSAGLISSSY